MDTFNFQTVPTYRPSQYEITLILFGLTDRVSPELRLDLGNAIDLAYDLQEIYQKNDRVSLVATKHDLVPRQWSGVNLHLALEENRLAYPDDIKLHKVSSVTGEGVSDLREYTGKSWNTFPWQWFTMCNFFSKSNFSSLSMDQPLGVRV